MVHPNILLKLLKKLKSKSKMPKEIFMLKEVISFYDEASGSEILVMPNDHYSTTMVDFGTKILGTQNATMKSISDFKLKYQSLEPSVFT
jgi:hypothetical protein